MSAEGTSPASPKPEAWPALNVNERRLLGVLIEKSKTTPDAYPMSVNSLVTGINQKSNRDPLLNLSDVDVEEALTSVQGKRLVLKIIGGRVERWKHTLYEAWDVSKVGLAVLGELLLRGAQTEGELRTRASRMEPIDTLEDLRAVLKPLKERGLIVYLSPEGRRGTMLTHGFYPPRELERLRGQHGAGAPEPAEAAAPAAAGPRVAAAPADEGRVAALEARLAAAEADAATVRATVADLQGQVARLDEQLRALKAALGA